MEMRQLVSTYLHGYGFETVSAGTVDEAHALLNQHRFDLVVLDLQLPGGDGWDLLQTIAERRRPPLIVTSNHAEEADRILTIESGADDYLVKPFSLRELVARARSVTRRVASEGSAPLRRVARFDVWSLDIAARHAQSPERSVDLTAGELAILRTLMERPHHVLTRTELLASTHQSDADVFDRTVDVLVSRLRRKLESNPIRPEFIQTVRGGGYCFKRDVSWHTTA
jgi:two-component system, OmpR family, response regulator